jgi:hypothetical protein
LAALVWPALSAGHRLAMPGLLRHAAASVYRLPRGCPAQAPQAADPAIQISSAEGGGPS